MDFHGREREREGEGREKTGTKMGGTTGLEWTDGFVIPKENFQDGGGGREAARSGTINLHSFTWHLYGKAARNQREMIRATRKSYYYRVALLLCRESLI